MNSTYDNLIDVATVAHVYSGKNGKCCCGCAGKHTYAKLYQARSSKNRGYDVEDKECNDKVVRLIVNKIIANKDKIDTIRPSYVSAVVDGRLYIAYFAN